MYVYLLSTLPSFTLDDPPPMTVATLVERCEPYLNEDEILALERPDEAAARSGAAGAIALRWSDGERQLRNAVARRRASTWQRAPDADRRDHRGFSVLVDAAVARAFEAPDPLQRERRLDDLRWTLLDDLARVAPWGFASLFAYARRLALAQLWSERDPAEGSRRLRGILDTLEAHHV